MAGANRSLLPPILLIVAGLSAAGIILLLMMREDDGFGPLVIPERARAIQRVDDNAPGRRFTFQVGEPFPATRIIAEIAFGHQNAGWVQESGLFFLTTEESLDTDWDDYIDSTTMPPVRRREYMMEWGNAAGDRALYFLRYETSAQTEDTPLLLHVNAAHFTADEVRLVQQSYGLVNPATMRATPLRPLPEPSAEPDPPQVD